MNRPKIDKLEDSLGNDRGLDMKIYSQLSNLIDYVDYLEKRLEKQNKVIFDKMSKQDTGRWKEIANKNKQDDHAQYIGAPGKGNKKPKDILPETITELIREYKNGGFRPNWILDVETYIYKSPISLYYDDKNYIKFVLCQDRTQAKNIAYLHKLFLKEPDHPIHGCEFIIILN